MPLIQLVSDAKLVERRRARVDGHLCERHRPEKRLVCPSNADGSLGTPTGLVERAHAAGLLVHVWTLRADTEFLPAGYKETRRRSSVSSSKLGVDGVFSDFPDIGAAEQ